MFDRRLAYVIDCSWNCTGLGGGKVNCEADGRANGSEVNPRGQGPRAEADAALGVHACESRDAGRAPPSSF